MARSLDQIRKDLAAVATETVKIDEKLQEIYGQYLEVLGAAVRQQLVLAAYHLCTQTYPEAFLALSVGHREKLQGALRQLGDQGRSHIEALVSMDNVSATLSLLLQSADGLSRNAIALSLQGEFFPLKVQQPTAMVRDRPQGAIASLDLEEDPEEGDLEDPALDGSEENAPEIPDPEGVNPEGVNPDAADPTAPEAGITADLQIPSPDWDAAPFNPDPEGADPEGADPEGADPEDQANATDPQTFIGALPPDAVAVLAAAMGKDRPKRGLSAATPDHPSPLHLAKRHVLLERQIRSILHTLSTLSNHLLKQAQILPDLPEAVLSAAVESDSEDSAPATPNLLSVIVEMGRERSEDDEDEDDEDGEDDDLLEDEDEDPLEEAMNAPERSMTHLVAINLRLVDIEFTDPQTALRRSKIQETLIRLKRLSTRYQKLQQEQARAEAESAWQVTWFDDTKGK
ncbi:hypothetical protein [Leptolyngbya sp. PCC 6406]|uniref:hypothetical protein n=1 Tax=Leptolyngbya sp. PCC 6406 TaxID=1173264 RepID=UPI000489D26A|nr:hypothetical protein [Leptolyngbya sp. PCC 6406]